VALALAVTGGVSLGYALSFAGFGTIPALAFLSLACPAVLCLITGSRHVLVSVLFALTMMSTLTIHLVADSNPYVSPAMRVVIMLVLTAFAVALAAFIASMFVARRRAA
jgi:hypothetical protein